jgi:hypothetical protein
VLDRIVNEVEAHSYRAHEFGDSVFISAIAHSVAQPCPGVTDICGI